MSDSAPTSALFDGRASAGQKAILYGLLLMLASLVTALAIYGVIYLVSLQNQRDAGRMMIDAQKGTPYLATIVNGMAASAGRPYRGL